MANTNINSGTDLRTPADIACEFQKGLRDERAQHQSLREASVILIQRSEMARGYKLCSLAKTEETWDFYRDLNNYELFDFQKSADIIKENVAGYAKKDEELGALIQEGSKLLKELKAGLAEANNLSCAMRNCLQSIIGFGDDCVPDELKEVTDIAKSLSKRSGKAAKAMIEIAGIHTWANLNRLKPLDEKLSKAALDLETTIGEYIKKAAEAAKTAQEDLTKVIDELNKEEFAFFEETSVLNAIEETIEFLCEGEPCPSIECVDEICKGMSAEENGSGNSGQAKQGKYAAGDES